MNIKKHIENAVASNNKEDKKKKQNISNDKK